MAEASDHAPIVWLKVFTSYGHVTSDSDQKWHDLSDQLPLASKKWKKHLQYARKCGEEKGRHDSRRNQPADSSVIVSSASVDTKSGKCVLGEKKLLLSLKWKAMRKLKEKILKILLVVQKSMKHQQGHL